MTRREKLQGHYLCWDGDKSGKWNWEVVPIGLDAAIRSGVADTEEEAAREARYAGRLLEAENIIAPDVP
jgi:hypothetical protein